MCGAPEFVEQTTKNSIVFIGRLASIEYEGQDPYHFERKQGDIRTTLNPYKVLLFDKIKVVKGEYDTEQFFIRFSTDGGMNNWFPKPPKKIGAYFLFSFNNTDENENGTYEKPYRVGPCNMFKRI